MGDYPVLARYVKTNQMGPQMSEIYPAVVRRSYEYRRAG